MSKPKTNRTKSGYHDVPATGDSVFLGKDVFPNESVRRKRLANDTNEQGVELKAQGPMPPKQPVTAKVERRRDPPAIEVMRERVATALGTILLLDGDWPAGHQSSMPEPVRHVMEAYGRATVGRLRVKPSPARITEAEALVPLLYTLEDEARQIVCMAALGYSWGRIGAEMAIDWRTAKKRERKGIEALIAEERK